MTVFKRMGSILSLVFSNYNEARAFREAFIRLMVYTILFAIGYKLNLVFDNVPDGRIFDGYAMSALFCGLSVDHAHLHGHQTGSLSCYRHSGITNLHYGQSLLHRKDGCSLNK